MTLYPLFLKLEEKKVLVVGGGRSPKKSCLAFSARHRRTVVAPQISEKIRDGRNRDCLNTWPMNTPSNDP